LRTILRYPVILAILFVMSACTAMPARQAVDAANVIYTQGSSHNMIAAQVPVDAARVYESFLHVLSEHPEFDIVTRKDAAMMLEVTRDGFRVTGQVTALGAGKSLLYVWADAGDSGYSGREVSERAVQAICDDLGVNIERVDY
jgi:hypothetical protein